MKTLDRLLSVLLALALFSVGVFVAVEVGHAALNRPGHLLMPYESWARFGRQHSWSDGIVRASCVAAAVAGLLLLLAALKPRRPGFLTLRTDLPVLEAGVSRRSLRNALAVAATDVDGVDKAKVTLGKRRAKVIAISHLRDTTGLPDRLRAHVQSWLDDLGLVVAPRLSVRVKRKES